MADHTRWQTWLGAAQDGDQRAYRAILGEILPWLRDAAVRRWPRANTAEIEDIVQETLLALHRNLHLYDRSRPVEPFLYGILKLKGADTLRRRARHGSRETRLEDLPVTSKALVTNAEQDNLLDLQAVTRGMSRLSRRDRHLLEMIKLRETSLRDASAATGMSVSALKVATLRAIRRLRRHMGVDDAE